MTVQHVASGHHAGWRWAVSRFSDLKHPFVDIQHWDGAIYTWHAMEMERATPVAVSRWIDQAEVERVRQVVKVAHA